MLRKTIFVSISALLSLSLYCKEEMQQLSLAHPSCTFYPPVEFRSLHEGLFSEVPQVVIEENKPTLHLDYPWNYRKGNWGLQGITLLSILSRDQGFLIFKFPSATSQEIMRYAGTLRSPYNPTDIRFFLIQQSQAPFGHTIAQSHFIQSPQLHDFILENLRPITDLPENDARRIAIAQDICKMIMSGNPLTSSLSRSLSTDSTSSSSHDLSIPSSTVAHTHDSGFLTTPLEITPSMAPVEYEEKTPTPATYSSVASRNISQSDTTPTTAKENLLAIAASTYSSGVFSLPDETTTEVHDDLQLTIEEEEHRSIVSTPIEEVSLPGSSTLLKDNTITVDTSSSKVASKSTSKVKKKKKKTEKVEIRDPLAEKREEELLQKMACQVQKQKELLYQQKISLYQEIEKYASRALFLDGEELRTLYNFFEKDPKKYCLSFDDLVTNTQYQIYLSQLCKLVYPIKEDFEKRNNILFNYLYPQERKGKKSVIRQGDLSSGPVAYNALGTDLIFLQFPKEFKTATQVVALLDRYVHIDKEGIDFKSKETPEQIASFKKVFIQELRDTATEEQYQVFFKHYPFNVQDCSSLQLLEESIHKRFKKNKELKEKITDIRTYFSLMNAFEEFLKNPSSESYKTIREYCSKDDNFPNTIHKRNNINIIPFIIAHPHIGFSDNVHAVDFIQTLSLDQKKPLEQTFANARAYYESQPELTLQEVVEWQWSMLVSHILGQVTAQEASEICDSIAGRPINYTISDKDLLTLRNTWHTFSFIIDSIRSELHPLKEQYAATLYGLLENMPEVTPAMQNHFSNLKTFVKLSLAKPTVEEKVSLLQKAMRAIWETKLYSHEDRNTRLLHLLTYAHQWGLTSEHYQRIYSNTLCKFAQEKSKKNESEDKPFSFKDHPLSQALVAYKALPNYGYPSAAQDMSPENFLKSFYLQHTFNISLEIARHQHNTNRTLLSLLYVIELLKYADTAPEEKKEKYIESIKNTFSIIPYPLQVLGLYYEHDLLKKYGFKVLPTIEFKK